MACVHHGKRAMIDSATVVFIVEQKLVGILFATLVAFYQRLGIHINAVGPLCEKLRHPQNRKYITHRNAVTENGATATCNTY